MYGHPSSLVQNKTLGKITRCVISWCHGEGQDDTKWGHIFRALFQPGSGECFPFPVNGCECLAVTLGMCLMVLMVLLTCKSKWGCAGQQQSYFWSRILLAKKILLAEDGANSWPLNPGQSTEICQMLASLLEKKMTFSQFAVEQAGQENYKIWLRQHLVKFRGKHCLLLHSPSPN